MMVILAVQMEEWLVLFSLWEGYCPRQHRPVPFAFPMAKRVENCLNLASILVPLCGLWYQENIWYLCLLMIVL